MVCKAPSPAQRCRRPLVIRLYKKTIAAYEWFESVVCSVFAQMQRRPTSERANRCGRLLSSPLQRRPAEVVYSLDSIDDHELVLPLAAPLRTHFMETMSGRRAPQGAKGNGKIGTYHLAASSRWIHRAIIFNLSLTLVAGRRRYFSDSEIGNTLASQYGKVAGSLGGWPYAASTR